MQALAARDMRVGAGSGLAARDGMVDTDTWRVNRNLDEPVARPFSERYAPTDELAQAIIPRAPTH